MDNCFNRAMRRAAASLMGLLLGALLGWTCLEAFCFLHDQRFVTDERIHDDPELGYAPDPDSRNRCRAMVGSRLLFDKAYAIGHDGLRKGSSAGDGASEAVLFFGDSFTFGDAGVRDRETFPARFEEEAAGKFKAYNLAYSAYGPHQMLASLEARRPLRLLGRRRAVHSVFLAIPQQILRVGGYQWWLRGGPRYVLENGEARRRGSFAPPFWLRPLWRHSPAFRKISKSLCPKVPLDADLDLFAAVLSRSRDILRKEYGSDLLLILWSGFDPRSLLRLRARGLRFVTINEIIPDIDTRPEIYRIPVDRHPNALTHALIARYLARRWGG